MTGDMVILAEGDRIMTEVPYSEVCMHMRVAGTVMMVELLPAGLAQLYRTDGTKFSFPVTAGEAGLYRNAEGQWYGYPE